MSSDAVEVREAWPSLRGRARGLSPSRRATRSWFVLVGLGASIALAWFAPALARAVGVSMETAIFSVASFLMAGIGWRSFRALDSLERRSIEDPVTHVGNRLHGEEQLAREVERANRSRMPLSLVLLDLDNLKKLNDAHGHACGDRALSVVGDALLESCRSRDVPARFGGDEFALVLPRTRASEALVVAERVRVAIARRRAELGAPFDPAVTVSVGVADLDASGARTSSALLAAADRALYAAKTGGRDRVEIAEPMLQVMSSGVIALDAWRRKKQPPSRRTS